jgi:hypothetical protein
LSEALKGKPAWVVPGASYDLTDAICMVHSGISFIGTQDSELKKCLRIQDVFCQKKIGHGRFPAKEQMRYETGRRPFHVNLAASF